MNEIIPFDFEGNDIRAITDEYGEPWFIAKDVCLSLGLENVTKALIEIDQRDKGETSTIGNAGNKISKLRIINESGIYALIMKSRKPEAKRFQRWVTHDVLPSLRKTGKYEISNASEIDLIIQSAKALKVLQTKQTEQESRIIELEAKTEHNSGTNGYYTIIGWCRKIGITSTLAENLARGRLCGNLSRELNIEIGRVPDERYGFVNSYHEDILASIKV